MIQLPGSGSRRPTDATPHATRRGADGSGSFDGVFTRAQVDNFQDIFTECVRRHNGIHAIGIYSLAGEPVAYDQNIAKKKADEQRAYYEVWERQGGRGVMPSQRTSGNRGTFAYQLASTISVLRHWTMATNSSLLWCLSEGMGITTQSLPASSIGSVKKLDEQWVGKSLARDARGAWGWVRTDRKN
jgi:hypothetical protein